MNFFKLWKVHCILLVTFFLIECYSRATYVYVSNNDDDDALIDALARSEKNDDESPSVAEEKSSLKDTLNGVDSIPVSSDLYIKQLDPPEEIVVQKKYRSRVKISYRPIYSRGPYYYSPWSWRVGVGVTVGVVLLIILIVGLYYCIRCCIRRHDEEAEEYDGPYTSEVVKPPLPPDMSVNAGVYMGPGPVPTVGQGGPVFMQYPEDRKLAQSAQMYHYQQQKEMIVAMERAEDVDHKKKKPLTTEEEEESRDPTAPPVYETPGLASSFYYPASPPANMEVPNPLFQAALYPPLPDGPPPTYSSISPSRP